LRPSPQLYENEKIFIESTQAIGESYHLQDENQTTGEQTYVIYKLKAENAINYIYPNGMISIYVISTKVVCYSFT